MKTSHKTRLLTLLLSLVVTWFAPCLYGQTPGENTTTEGKVRVLIDGEGVEPSFGTTAGSWFYHAPNDGTQALLLGFPSCGLDGKPDYRIVADLTPNSTIQFILPEETVRDVSYISFEKRSPEGVNSQAVAKIEIRQPGVNLLNGVDDTSIDAESQLHFNVSPNAGEVTLVITAPDYDPASPETPTCAVELFDFVYHTEPIIGKLSFDPTRKPQSLEPIETSPNFRPALANAMVEWDWRMQDGIGVQREPRSYQDALKLRLPQGRALLDDLQKTIDDASYESLTPYDANIADNFESFQERLDTYREQWQKLEKDFTALQDTELVLQDTAAQELWLSMRRLKRDILLNAPYFQFGSLLFVKGAPSVMSHQLTQVYGYCARPGGGLYLLDAPGKSMQAREITPRNLPQGSFMTPEISYDAKSLYFAFCDVPKTPQVWRDPETMSRRYSLYSASLTDLIRAEGQLDAKRLTFGDYDDFSPTLLPDGDLIFCSTRRGGFHRCGGGPCYVYTLARCKSDGSDPRPISFHETNEWFPIVAHNGRIIYTRWDYVDRDAVYYQQLWSTRQDGTDVRIFYGNNTFNPPGFWEPQAVPGSDKIMAVGGPHHGLSAGSVVLIDPNKGVDGPEPVERLTPDVLYPEGEAPLPLIPQLPFLCDFDYQPTGYWQATRPAQRAEETVEARRWPVQAFKSPVPLAEKYFIASYSYDKLLGEAGPNLPNQFGLYYCDAFGNRELIYRDPNISSMWALPVRTRPLPPTVASVLDETRRDAEQPTGTFFLQNVYESWPNEIPDKITALRIVQVLPKTTPNANQPRVGEAFASPGKQVLGVVPVDEDGSAFFEAPAKTPLLFQALDENGRMVQGMRSLVYLQPGESAGCVGCHENRASSAQTVKTTASMRQPSTIQPGPQGSKPFSYPLLVQPILDKKCVCCHNNDKAEGNVNLSGEPEGDFTKSYNALVSRVAYTAWGMPQGNYEPMTEPDRFGARASELTKILQQGHYQVELTDEEWERLNTWMDVNALFYGTFKPEDQARQQRGELIEGPELE
ncbi:MAG: hypothetical protein Q4G03_12260 [Planctomycetia bacterium]|nr:hypothetical protein [Planctomycetia bacterium]